MKPALFSGKALTEKAKIYVSILREDGATKKELVSTKHDFKEGYRQAQRDDKEDLRALLEEKRNEIEADRIDACEGMDPGSRNYYIDGLLVGDEKLKELLAELDEEREGK